MAQDPARDGDVRQACHPDAVRGFDTAALRRHFLIERLFAPGEVLLTYSHVDRLVVGGAMPGTRALALPPPRAGGPAGVLARRARGGRGHLPPARP